MNISKAFTDYMVDNGYGTFGDDLFIGGVPLEAPDTCWWVLSAGGASEPRNSTGERLKSYIVSVFYRNTSTEGVYEQLQALEELINGAECIEFDDYTLIDMEAITFATDQDLDSEERTIGLMQVSLMVYQS